MSHFVIGGPLVGPNGELMSCDACMHATSGFLSGPRPWVGSLPLSLSFSSTFVGACPQVRELPNALARDNGL
ncbi:hypothetical protein V6N12_069683 [Hibiscus sabdariffa]|uniref:Uncharacterized protein n=1 Tax=Hibiscus sabdariffa TaxID=183260 RepID=A0ABR2FEJ0_9ROSI